MEQAGAGWRPVLGHICATNCWQSALITPRRARHTVTRPAKIDDWGHVGAERTRNLPGSIYWTPAGRRDCIPRRSCDSDQISGANLVLMMFPGGCIFQGGVAAEEVGKSPPMFQRRSTLLDWGLVAW
jgi:hypothetical protein